MSAALRERWLGVEPRHLVTFVCVADTGSFRGAAARIGYVQSAVSQQIAQLERALDARLIERSRGNRELTLTRNGEALLTHARRVADHMRAAWADIRHIDGEMPLRIAVEPATMRLLPGLASRLAGHEQASLSITEAPAEALPALITSGAADMAMGAVDGLPAGVSRRLLQTDAWVLVAPKRSELAAGGPLDSLSALHGTRIVYDRWHPLPVSLDQLMPDHAIACDRLSRVLDLVRANAGYAILPAMAAPDDDPGLRTIDMGDLMPQRVISLLWLRARRLTQMAALGEPAA
jgi:DNA-binding transcriptional LysR family regulator